MSRTRAISYSLSMCGPMRVAALACWLSTLPISPTRLVMSSIITPRTALTFVLRLYQQRLDLSVSVPQHIRDGLLLPARPLELPSDLRHLPL